MLDLRPPVVLFTGLAAFACAEPEPPECATYRVAEVRGNVAAEEARVLLERAEAASSDHFDALPDRPMAEVVDTAAWRRFETASDAAEAAEVRLLRAEKALSDARSIRIAQGCAALKELEVQALEATQ